MAGSLLDAVDEAKARPGGKVFYSGCRNLVLDRVSPLSTVEMGTGVRHTVREGLSYEFRNAGGIGVLVVFEGQDVMKDGRGWLKAGEPDGVDRDAVQALKAHKSYGRLFYLEGEEPDRLLPTEEDFLAAVHRATAELDVDRLEELFSEEEQSHKRPLLLRTAREALRTARETREGLEARAAEVDAQNAAEAPEPRSEASSAKKPVGKAGAKG